MLTLGFGVNARNEIAFAQTGGAGGPQTSYVYDAAGNLIFDGERVYRYDAWNRVVQISAGHMGTVYQTSGGGTENPEQVPVADQLLKHFTYDGLGRLVRTQSPWPDPATAAGEVRSERFYYDGVRRVQEVLLDPLLSLTSALASSNATLQSLAQQASTQNGVPLDGEATPATLEQGQASTLVGGAATFTGVLWREYVWGPGDGFGSGGGGVDELLVQFDQNDNAWWALVDAGGDVAALAGETGTPTAPGAARVAAQWTYDAYGNVTSADHLHPHALLHCGHKGLFAERLDVGAAEVETTGFASAESPRLVPFAVVIYHARNRWYSPTLGRWLSADPNATGMSVLDSSPTHGRQFAPAVMVLGITARHHDGVNIYEYLGSAPQERSDGLGLEWNQNFPGLLKDTWEIEKRGLKFLAGAADPMGMIGSMYQSLFTQYGANLEADVDWATDWSLPDDMYSRTSDRWVMLSLMRGAASHFGLDYMLDDEMGEGDGEEDLDGDDEGAQVPAQAYTLKPTYVGPVKGLKGISRKVYKQNIAKYRAKKWQLWHEEVKNNPTKYAKNSMDRIRARLNPRDAQGRAMVIHHKEPLARGGDPVDRANLDFTPRSKHIPAHKKR